MNPTHCPICYEPLVVREVGPCMDCGFYPDEVEHARSGIHQFREYRLFGDLKLVLCNFCDVDFGSYQPEYFGRPVTQSFGIGQMEFIRDVEPFIGQDKCCLACERRLKFLEFLVAAREFNQARFGPV